MRRGHRSGLSRGRGTGRRAGPRNDGDAGRSVAPERVRAASADRRVGMPSSSASDLTEPIATPPVSRRFGWALNESIKGGFRGIRSPLHASLHEGAEGFNRVTLGVLTPAEVVALIGTRRLGQRPTVCLDRFDVSPTFTKVHAWLHLLVTRGRALLRRRRPPSETSRSTWAGLAWPTIYCTGQPSGEIHACADSRFTPCGTVTLPSGDEYGARSFSTWEIGSTISSFPTSAICARVPGEVKSDRTKISTVG